MIKESVTVKIGGVYYENRKIGISVLTIVVLSGALVINANIKTKVTAFTIAIIIALW